MKQTIYRITRLSVASFCLAMALSVFADVSLKTEQTDGKKVYRIENYRISLVINPQRGGAVTSYKDKLGGNVELIHQAPRNGLCMDHFQCQPWPGEMLDAQYGATVARQSPEECAVKLSYKVKGVWRQVEYPKIQDIVLEKTYVLRKGSPALECEVKITAPGKSSKLMAYWLQNVFFASGKYDMETDMTFRPTVRGVRRKNGGHNNGHTGREDFIKDFSDGWMALLDTKARNGLVILSNYHELDISYVCAGNRTVEPMYRIKYLPAGASTTYTTYIVPVVGLDNIVTATRNFVAGYDMKTTGKGKGNISLSVVRSVNPVDQLTMKLQVMSAQPGGKTVDAGEVKLVKPADKPKSASVSFAGAGADPLVVKGAVSAIAQGKVMASAFEDYYNGSYKWGENINTDMSTPFYKGERPEQIVKLQKPKKMKLKDIWSLQVWYVDGLLDDFYKMTEGVRLSGTYRDKTRRDRSFVVKAGAFGNKLTSFPYDYEKFLEYDLIILGGIKKDALGKISDEMLCDFIKAGGGMIVLGGPMAYGMSHMKDTDIAKMWPVEISDKTFDMVKMEDGIINVKEDVPFLEDLDWSAQPRTVFVHDVKVKPWGKVILTAGDKPFLVVGETGPNKARIACILAPPMGTVEEGQTPFWNWKDWPYLMRQIIWWMERRDEYFVRK